MCGRYILTSPPCAVAEQFAIEVRDNFPPRCNIAPTQPIAIIRFNQQRAREYALVRWGFIPSWMGREKGRPLINARAETVADKPSFRHAFKRRRCLIPADGFYEWSGEAGAKQPYLVRAADGAMIAFAGIWETVLDPNGSEADTVAILTHAAGPDMRPIHGREPVVIDAEYYHLWLEADERDLGLIEPLLHPRAKGFWAAVPVSTEVNNVRNDGLELIEPVAGSALRTDLFE